LCAEGPPQLHDAYDPADGNPCTHAHRARRSWTTTSALSPEGSIGARCARSAGADHPRSGLPTDRPRGGLPSPAASRARPDWDGPQLQRALHTDRVAVALALARHRLSLPLARAAHAFVLRKVWSSFGYARPNDYARERLGRSGRW